MNYFKSSGANCGASACEKSSENRIKNAMPSERKRGAFVFNRMNKTLCDYSFVIAFFIVLIFFAVIFFVNGFYPFGDLSVSWCDGDQQFIPLLCDFKDVLEGKASFFLSTANSGGMNFYGVFFFNLSSPFSFLVLFFDKADMGGAFNVIVCLKLATAAATFTFLLKRKTANPVLLISGSVLYAFSGYAMMYYQIAQWLDVYYVFPLLLLGLEKMTDGGSNVLYAVTLFLTVLFQFYIAYAVVVFVCLYAFLYVIYNKKDGKFAFSFAISSLLAALVGCVVLLPCFMQYLGSMRSSSGIVQSLAMSNIFPPTYTSFPTFFCLAPIAACAVYYFCGNFKNFRFALLILCVLPIIFEPIAKAWQTFNYMAFPTRYGFIVIAMCIYFAVGGMEKLAAKKLSEKAVDAEGLEHGLGHNSAHNSSSDNSIARLLDCLKGKSLSGKILYSLIALAVVCLFGVFSVNFYKVNDKVLSGYSQSLWGNANSFKGLLIFACVSACVGIVLFVLLKFKLTFKNAVFGAIGLVIAFEAAFSCNVYMTSAVTMRSKESNISSRLRYITELEDLAPADEFYRVKVNSKLFEVNMVGALGYNSLSHYTSLNGREYMLTAKALGYSSYWMEVNSNGGTVFSDALVRNKYSLYYGRRTNAAYVTPSGKYSLVENTVLFPSAFFVEGFEQYDLDYSLDRITLQNAFFKRLVGLDDLFKKLEPSDFSGVVDLSNGGKTVYEIDGESGTLTYEATIDGKARLYLDLFDEYTNSLSEPTYGKISEVSVYKNGTHFKRTSNYPRQTANGVLDLGDYHDCTVKVVVKLSGSISATSFGVYTADLAVLENAVNGLIGSDLTQKGNIFNARISASESGSAFICLPYDDGYRATVNGKKAEIKPFGGFIAVKVPAGENDIRLTFVPKGFTFGLIISVLGVALAVLYLVLRKRVIDRLHAKVFTVCRYGVIALGAVVLIVIYLFPIVACLFL